MMWSLLRSEVRSTVSTRYCFQFDWWKF